MQFISFCLLIAYFPCSNKRAVQGGRLSAITMALQYGSESEEDAALAGRHFHIVVLLAKGN